MTFLFEPLEASNFRVTSVAIPEVTLAELKTHLGIYEDDFDNQLNNFILPTAQELATQIMGEFISETNVTAYYSRLQENIQLPHREIASITSVTYIDENHQVQTLVNNTDYVVDSTYEFPLITVLNTNYNYSDRFANPVSINYVAGIPQSRQTIAISQAVMILAYDLFYNRGNYANSQQYRATAERLLAPLKRVAV